MNSGVDFFFQVRAPHVVETRENGENAAHGSPQQ
jgi:hypothetical protein